MNRLSWLLLVLLVVLGISRMWSIDQKGSFSWTKCKESLFVYIVSNKCTLREMYKDKGNQIYH